MAVTYFRSNASKRAVFYVAGKTRRSLFSSPVVWAYWLINVVSLVVLIGWVFSDGRFAGTALKLTADVHSLVERTTATGQQEPQLAARLIALQVVGGLAVVSAVGIVMGLFFGGAAHRRVRSWLSLTVLVAMWLTVCGTWPDLLWRGQVFRLRGQLPEMQTTAEALSNNWPTGDGERAELGPFLAYPLGKPQVLLLLTPAYVPRTNVSFSTVERSDQGALRFQLTGNELGAWLEWHPSHDDPRAFIGGLLQRYELDRFSSLGDDWFLVRYK